MSASNHVVRRATPDEAQRLTEILATAFMDDPISGWIFPDRADRERLHPGFFRIFIDLVLAEGEIYTTEGYAGAALWLNVNVTQPHSEDGDEMRELFRQSCGPYADRFFVLDDLMTKLHPSHESHWYLPFIAVAPDWQNKGVGTALLRDRFAFLDEARSPGYLEASSPRNAQLYARLGFQRLGGTIDLPDGPSLYPMWRRAR